MWDRYLTACEDVAYVQFAMIRGMEADAVAKARHALRSTCERIYELISAAACSDLGTERIVVARSERLRRMTRARIVAVARPGMCAARQLPWDLSCDVALCDAPGFAGAVPRWCLPSPERLTIVAPKDIELDRVMPAAGTTEADKTVLSVRTAKWLVEIEHALEQARTAGAEVIRPAGASDLLAALDGRHRECVQLVAHTDGHRDTMFLDGDRLSLTGLAAAITEVVAAGWRSPVRTIDLATCGSEGKLSRALRAAGIEYVSGRQDKLHTRAIARWLRVLHTRRLFDGETPIAHAWLLASLHDGT
ncbi:MAG TPA: hypothetical protein VGD80_12520 [Kofleriaceae bacterium]